MNEDDLEKMLKGVDGKPDAARKQQNINAALSEFSKINSESSQGNEAPARPTTDNIQDIFRSKDMDRSYLQRWMYSGLASAAVLVLAVTFVFNVEMPTDNFSGEKSPTAVVFDDLTEMGTLAETKRQDSRSRELEAAQASEQWLEEVVVVGNSAEANIGKSSVPGLLNVVKDGKANQPSPSRSPELDFASSKQRIAAAPQISADLKLVPQPPIEHRDNFEVFDANPIRLVESDPVSTFSIDVDTASYSFIRKQLNQGVLPQKSAVRLEEMVNYFSYDYDVPDSSKEPFASTVSILNSPWNDKNKLIHIGIKGFEPAVREDLRSNLVFLLDVSGSMNQPDKLPLVKQSMSMLLSQLHPEDTVAIAVYAGAAGTVLEPTQVKDKRKIMSALNRLSAGGSTAGAAGIQLAYQLAEENFVEDGVNRVFLATDGDFNVGVSNPDELQGFVERKRQSGVYLSILGFGQGNYQDALMQKLAQNGNGIAAYIDTYQEAQKVLVQEARAQLFPIANDVKLQVEFNPETVAEYRLLGYETRALATEDFKNDKVDAGEIGAGHTVTAIYEITPRGEQGLISESRYSQSTRDYQNAPEGEYAFLKIRYKKPGESISKLTTRAIGTDTSEGNVDSRFAIATAGFAQLLKGGQYTGDWSYEDALELAIANKGIDAYGYRAEFTQLIRQAMVASELR